MLRTLSCWCLLLALLATPYAVAPSVAHADPPAPFGILANAFAVTAWGTPPTLIVGDSLIVNLNAKDLANRMAAATGRGAVVAGSAGASTKNFVTPGWLDNPPWGGPNLQTVEGYNASYRIGVTVIALGSNDARIMTSAPASYGVWSNAAALIDAINQAKTHSTCVFLVNVADHWSQASSANVAAVNRNIDGATTYSWANKVFKIDWAGYSAGHESWFASPGDIHHSAEGRKRYAELIWRSVADKIRAGLC